jgi:hypothetical protein
MILALCIATLITLLSLLHVYWAVGGKLGLHAALPGQMNHGESTSKPLFVPNTLMTFVVAGLLLASALIVLQAGRVLELFPSWMASLGIWTIGSAFLLRSIGEFRYVGFFKRVKSTRFARMDTRVYSPFTLFLGLSILWLAYQS